MASNQNDGIRIVVPQHSLKQKNKGSNKGKEILDQTVRQIEDSLMVRVKLDSWRVGEVGNF